MANKPERPSKDINDLYLNKKMSDVTIVINGVELPAHRDILTKRCQYFETMFESGMIESVSNRVEIHETSVDAFKSVLKYIYFGTIELNQIDNDLEVLRLAHMYGLDDLVEQIVDFLKGICSIDKACSILNSSILLSLDELTDHVLDYMNDRPCEILKHESIKHLSKNALIFVLTSGVVLTVPNAKVFQAVVNWMKANPAKSADFPDVLKNVILGSINISELKDVPSDVLDAVLTLIRNKHVKGPVYKLKDKNIALSKYGVIVVAAGETSFFDENGGSVLKHEVSSFEESIIVDLGRRFLLNSLNMHLGDADDDRNFSYWIAVSEDNINWTRIIDHSKYACRSFQKLHFMECAVRYLRICGTAPVDDTFEISHLEAFYTTEPFEVDPETTLLIPSCNVALASKHAKVLQGYSSPVNAIIDGTFEGYSFGSGYTRHTIGDDNCIIVQLPQPYLIDSMKLLLWDRDDRVYSYHVEVSTDQNTWTRIFDEGSVASWRELQFEKQPVVFIKLTGTYNSINIMFHCVHLECPVAKQLSNQ